LMDRELSVDIPAHHGEVSDLALTKNKNRIVSIGSDQRLLVRGLRKKAGKNLEYKSILTHNLDVEYERIAMHPIDDTKFVISNIKEI